MLLYDGISYVYIQYTYLLDREIYRGAGVAHVQQAAGQPRGPWLRRDALKARRLGVALGRHAHSACEQQLQGLFHLAEV